MNLIFITIVVSFLKPIPQPLQEKAVSQISYICPAGAGTRAIPNQRKGTVPETGMQSQVLPASDSPGMAAGRRMAAKTGVLFEYQLCIFAGLYY